MKETSTRENGLPTSSKRKFENELMLLNQKLTYSSSTLAIPVVGLFW